MISLILAIVTSAIISILMRISETKVKNTFGLFLANYIVCTALSGIYMKGQSPFTMVEGSGFAMELGCVGGVFFLLSFILLKFNISKNGVVLASTFMKLGVLVPIVTAMVFFQEIPSPWQIGGFICAIAAILIINGIGGTKTEESKGRIWLIILLLCGGFTDSLANIYDKNGTAAAKDQYLFFIFVVATLLCIIILIVQKHVPTKWELLFGACIGIPNYYTTRFLLASLSKLPAIFVYPVYNVATILLVTFVGVLAFKEKLDKRKIIGLGLIIAALVLLNL